MSEFDALLANILAHPEDDLPRLVFADWLEETGQPALAARAQFIRLQITAANLPAGSSEKYEAERDAATLLVEFGEAGSWDRVAPATWADVEFLYCRGFIAELVTTPAHLVSEGLDILSTSPVRILKIRGTVEEEEEESAIARLGFLSPDLTQIESLHLYSLGIGYRSNTFAIRLLRELGPLPSLIELVINDCLSNAIACIALTRYISASPFASSLRKLDLSNNPINDHGAAALSALRYADCLLTLDLTRTRVTDEGRRLLRSHFGDRVRFEWRPAIL